MCVRLVTRDASRSRLPRVCVVFRWAHVVFLGAGGEVVDFGLFGVVVGTPVFVGVVDPTDRALLDRPLGPRSESLRGGLRLFFGGASGPKLRLREPGAPPRHCRGRGEYPPGRGLLNPEGAPPGRGLLKPPVAGRGDDPPAVALRSPPGGAP